MPYILTLIFALGLACSSPMAAQTSSGAEPSAQQPPEATAQPTPEATAQEQPPEAPTPGPASQPIESAKANYIKFGGFVRGWASFNMQDQPELQHPPLFPPAEPLATTWIPFNSAGTTQMARASLELTADAKTGPVTWRAVGRTDQEAMTEYEKHLQLLVQIQTPGGPGSHMRDQYDQTQLREFYMDFNVGSRLHFRLGKQQVCLGRDGLLPSDRPDPGLRLPLALFPGA